MDITDKPLDQYLSDYARIVRYVRRYFERHHQTEWPTVAKVAKATGLRYGEVEEYCELVDGPLMRTQWNVLPPDPLGQHYVEICE